MRLSLVRPLLVAAALAWGLPLAAQNAAGQQAVMPPVTGMTLDSARDALRRFQLQVETRFVPADTPRGRVVDQRPAPRTPIRFGQTVLLDVSSGPPQEPARVRVPPVVGENGLQAMQEIQEAGLIPVPTPGSDRGGTVTDQDPDGGVPVLVGSRVRLTIAPPRPARVPVPNLFGQTLTGARSRLSDARLRMGTVDTVESARPAGTVTGQQPSADDTVEVGTPVTLAIARPRTTRVPPLVDAPEAVARQRIAAAGLRVAGIAGLDRPPPRIVTDQSPDPGTVVPAGSGVRIALATQASPVPDDADDPVDPVDPDPVDPDPVDPDPVDPLPPDPADPPSDGPLAAVPDVTGRVLGDALRVLAVAGFRASVDSAAAEAGSWLVAAQVPGPDGSAQAGSIVALAVVPPAVAAADREGDAAGEGGGGFPRLGLWIALVAMGLVAGAWRAVKRWRGRAKSAVPPPPVPVHARARGGANPRVTMRGAPFRADGMRVRTRPGVRVIRLVGERAPFATREKDHG